VGVIPHLQGAACFGASMLLALLSRHVSCDDVAAPPVDSPIRERNHGLTPSKVKGWEGLVALA
jgi:hypothetical protein